MALPAAAGTAAASAVSAAAIVFTTAKAVIKIRGAAEAAAEAADAAAVPAAAGKASKCPEEQQTKSLNPPSNLALLCHSSDRRHGHRYHFRFVVVGCSAVTRSPIRSSPRNGTS